MTTTFELPQDIRFTEELGLNLVFQEVIIIGVSFLATMVYNIVASVIHYLH